MFHLLLIAATLPFCLAQYGGGSAPSSAAAAATPTAAAVTIPSGAVTVTLAPNGNFVFQPNSLNVSQGGFVAFQIPAGIGHGIVQSSFSNPCQPIGNGFGTPLVQDAEVFVVQINSTDPIWFYCPQTSHCQSGMVGVINPSPNATLEEYTAAAKGTKSSGQINSGNTVQGGQLGPVAGGGGGSSGANVLKQSMALVLLGLAAAIFMA